jgi:hypothetical protein
MRRKKCVQNGSLSFLRQHAEQVLCKAPLSQVLPAAFLAMGCLAMAVAKFPLLYPTARASATLVGLQACSEVSFRGIKRGACPSQACY